MRRLAILSLSVVILFTMASLVFGAVTVKIKSGKEIRLYKDYHALVVGIGDYDHWPDLRGAVQDAEEVAQTLKGMGMTVTTLLNPTSAQLKAALNTLIYGPGIEKDRAILFFYSGHGETAKLATGKKLGYIVPKDAPLQARDRAGFADKAISMNQIETHALLIQSKHVLMVFDSCFSGTVFASLKSAPTDISEKSARAVRQFITAGNDEEQVPDESVFKTCFIQGIKGEADFNKDGYVTGSELGMYLDSTVVNYTRGGQHPQYGTINNPKLDKGDFIFVANGGTLIDEPGPSPVATGTLRVSADVSGARVYIDGADRGGVPGTLTLDPKTYQVEVQRQGYDPWRTQVTIEAGRTASLTAYLTAERPRMARLYVNPAPSDARIRILNIGPKYQRGITLDAGNYHVEVSKKGYETEKRWVNLAPGENRYESFQLNKSIEQVAEVPFFTNSLGMRMIGILNGSFMMGSPSSESGRKSNETQHRVTLTKPFLLQATEVTVGQWRQFVLDTGYQTKAEIEGGAFVARAGEKVGMRKGMNWNSLTDYQSDEHPVTCVSWNDCQAFIEWLNRKEEMKYRLPTEAEWEYACRAGTESAFPWGNDPTEACQFANIADQSLKRASQGTIVSNCDDGYWITAPAGKFKPNNWGLYDMIGNVLEWCSDWGGHYPDVAVKNPEGPSDGSDRILRGGSWGSSAKECRSASRSGFDPDSCHFILGFRLAADL